MMNHDDSPATPTTPPGLDTGDDMTTTSEAARQLGYASTKGISQLIKRGRIPGAVKQGSTWLVPVAWIREQQTRETMKNTAGSSPQQPEESPTKTGGCSSPSSASGSSPPADSSPVLPTPAPDLVPLSSPDSKGVAPTLPAPPASAPFTPLQLYIHSLARLVDKVETLRPIRQRIGNAVYERQQKHDGYYFPQPDESCSKYLCNWRGACIFYRSKGCPAYDEATRSDYRHAVGKAFYEEYESKLSLLEYPPCLCHPE